MKPYFTYEQLEQATNQGKQAFNSGLPIACPYIGEDSIPLRIRWLSGYNSARKDNTRTLRGSHYE